MLSPDIRRASPLVNFTLASVMTGPLALGLTGCDAANETSGTFSYDGKGGASRILYESVDDPNTEGVEHNPGKPLRTEYYHCEKNKAGVWEVVKEVQGSDETVKKEVARYISAGSVCDGGGIFSPEVP